MTRASRCTPRVALAFAFAACGFGHDVEQDGDYLVTSGTAVTDTVPYPLESLLIVEDDVDLGQTRIYLFTGNLRNADLGFADLRRIAAGHGSFQMAFDDPRGPIDFEDVAARAPPLRGRAGDLDFELRRIDDNGLRESGASRYLSSVETSEYHVAAYFGVLDDPPARIEIDRRGIALTLELSDPELRPEREDDELGVDYRSDGDYVVMELGQIIRGRGERGREVDALVRTTLEPDSEYGLGELLLTNVAGQGCWSDERTLTARLSQVARRYERRAGGDGDWAAIHQRIDAIEIAADTWSELVTEPNVSAYCEDFE